MKIRKYIFNRLKLSANRKKIVKNVYWAVLGKVVNIICGLLVGIMVARYLGPENFGLMNYVISYVTLFSILATFGLDHIEIRELAKSNVDKEILLGSAIAIRLVFASATIILVFLTLLLFECDRFTFAMVMIYTTSLLARTLNVIRSYFTSIVLNEYIVKSEISRTLISTLIKAVLLFMHAPLVWFIIASTFEFVLVGGGYIYSYQKKIGRIREWIVDWNVSWMLIRESFPMLLSGAAVIIYTRINEVMIRNMMDNASVGQFSVAAKITELAVFIPAVIAQTVTPLLVQAHQNDPIRYRQKRQQFMDLMVWSGIAMAAAMSITADPVIRILYGKDYLQAIPVLQILAWKAMLMGLASGSGQLIIIEGLQRYAVLRNLVGCVVSVALNYLLIPYLGVVGSAAATVITLLFSGYISHFFIKSFCFLVPIQNKSIFLGWREPLNYIKKCINI